MIHRNILAQLFLLFLLSGCVSTNKLNQQESFLKSTYQQIALEKFVEKAEFKLNSNMSYTLCTKMITAPVLNPNQLIEFFVYDIQQGEIIYEDKIANAKISWHTNTQLMISRQKGYIVNPADTGKASYIFDLQSKKKVTLDQTK